MRLRQWIQGQHAAAEAQKTSTLAACEQAQSGTCSQKTNTGVQGELQGANSSIEPGSYRIPSAESRSPVFKSSAVGCTTRRETENTERVSLQLRTPRISQPGSIIYTSLLCVCPHEVVASICLSNHLPTLHRPQPLRIMKWILPLLHTRPSTQPTSCLRILHLPTSNPLMPTARTHRCVHHTRAHRHAIFPLRNRQVLITRHFLPTLEATQLTSLLTPISPHSHTTQNHRHAEYNACYSQGNDSTDHSGDSGSHPIIVI